jgi:secretory lipase
MIPLPRNENARVPKRGNSDNHAQRGTCRHRGTGHRRRVRSAESFLRALIAALCVATLSPFIASMPFARADESRYLAFYTPPNPLPEGAPGDLIRTEPSRLVLEPSGQLGSFVGTGTRIMYRSTDAQGRPVAVTGTYIEPHVPWPGPGPRPLLAYATAPYGMGEQCAPSRLFNQGIHASVDTGFDLMFNLEEGFIATLLARGFAIVVTDGVGLGVHGSAAPQFLNRVAGGTALNDAARAAMRLPDTTLKPDGPVAFWGWLAGGGHAALAAAELAGAYAPELNVVGTYANGATTDLPSMLPPLDGNQLAGSMGWVLRGIQEAYPDMTQPIADSLTPRGVEMLANTSRQCMVQTGIDYAFRHLQPWFKEDLYQSVRKDPLKSILAMQRIGNVKPTGPVYLSHNRWDSFAPYESVVATARDWCAMGADVTLWTNEQPPFLNKMNTNALLTAFVDGERSMAWIADRFNGVPTTPNCS